MDFFEKYNELTDTQKSYLREQITKNCRITDRTFYNWIAEKKVPQLKDRLAIADITNRPVNIEFPDTI
jgi:hypothetical protein